MSAAARDLAAVVVERHGTTYAEEADIKLADKPSPLFRLLVLALLLSARISASVAVAAARELSKAGMRTPRKMADATWQQRVDALGRGHYRRYDERTASQLGEVSERLLDRYHGDLRVFHNLGCDVEAGLQQFKGVGPTGAAIFCREVQGVWTDLAPYVDAHAADGAERLGLPRSAQRLAGLVAPADLTRLVAGCVRAAHDDDVVEDVRAHTR